MGEGYNSQWIGDGLQYIDPPGTFEGIEDLEIMEIYDKDNITTKIPSNLGHITTVPLGHTA